MVHTSIVATDKAFRYHYGVREIAATRFLPFRGCSALIHRIYFIARTESIVLDREAISPVSPLSRKRMSMSRVINNSISTENILSSIKILRGKFQRKRLPVLQLSVSLDYFSSYCFSCHF